ncbi:MAG: hypothetical protein WC273_08150 [Dehalococcoidia bacterium]
MAATVTLGDGRPNYDETVEVDEGSKILVQSPFLVIANEGNRHLAAFRESRVMRVVFH